MTPDEFSNNYFGGGQAYIWRTDKITTKVGEFDAFDEVCLGALAQ